MCIGRNVPLGAPNSTGEHGVGVFGLLEDLIGDGHPVSVDAATYEKVGLDSETCSGVLIDDLKNLEGFRYDLWANAVAREHEDALFGHDG